MKRINPLMSNDMKFKGKVAQVMGIESGKSMRTGSDWRSQDFIFEYYETPTDRYADRVLLRVMNEKIDELDLKAGDIVEVGFGHSVREYQGRFFNEVRAYSVRKIEATQGTAVDAPIAQPGQSDQSVQQMQEDVAYKSPGDDLPF